MKVRLGDVATYINGYAFKPEDWSDSGLPIIRIQDLTGNSYKTNRFSGKYDKKFEVNDGDILISWSASIGVYIWRGEKAILNQHIFKVKFDKQVNICKKFFIYQVENILKKAILETHGATMKHLTKPVFDSLPFYLPDIKKQNEISAILDKISEIISLRQQQLKKLDELVKSRFIEQIGTIKDTKFKITELESLCEFIKDGTHQTPTYTDDKIHGFKFLSSKDVTTRKISWNKVKYITPDLHKQLYSVIAPKRGDILLAKNGTIGYAAVVDNDEIFDIYVSLALLRPKKENDVYYLWAAINNNETKAQFISSLKGIGVPNLHLREIKKTKIIVPPIDIQREFSYFITQTNKSKLEIQKSLDKLEILKKSLMQQYFD